VVFVFLSKVALGAHLSAGLCWSGALAALRAIIFADLYWSLSIQVKEVLSASFPVSRLWERASDDLWPCAASFLVGHPPKLASSCNSSAESRVFLRPVPDHGLSHIRRLARRHRSGGREGGHLTFLASSPFHL
jgi:hypothetical protein